MREIADKLAAGERLSFDDGVALFRHDLKAILAYSTISQLGLMIMLLGFGTPAAATVAVLPEAEEVDIHVNDADLKIDTMRAQGAGGQHVNKTESAVRITHIPTGIVAACQNDRSQHRNRAEAWAMLKSRLFELELRKRMSEQQKLEDSKTDIGWGHQIRSYVLDQSRIKDLRTNFETGNTKAVLDGDLDEFIAASLKQGV